MKNPVNHARSAADGGFHALTQLPIGAPTSYSPDDQTQAATERDMRSRSCEKNHMSLER